MFDLFSGGRDNSSVEMRLRRIERKLDLILQYLNVPVKDVELVNQVSAAVRQLADEGRKIEAIKLYREQTGAGLREAKETVESYMAR
jgi:Ribosomal protein L7/L12 C-terminal domain